MPEISLYLRDPLWGRNNFHTAIEKKDSEQA
jgi:hypothetical protein